MTALWLASMALVILTWPPLHRRWCGLRTDTVGNEGLLRWGQWVLMVLLCVAAGGARAGILPRLLGGVAAAVAALAALELAAGTAVHGVLAPLARRAPALAKLHRYLTENPDNLYYSQYSPHPFLQYTRPRGPVPGSPDNFYYGFKQLTLRDVPKPPGVIRVACLGASTTEAGFPEVLQELLAKARPTLTFQVLNFGITWWSSVHSVVNYILNVVDFKPDYVVVEENCNDHQYRGFPGLRGDAAHAYRLFLVPPTVAESFFRFSVLFRLFRTGLSWLLPGWFRKAPTMAEIGLQPGKTLDYRPEELYIVRRNLNTLCTVAAAEGSKVCLTTMPVSLTRNFGAEHARVYRPHAEQVNHIIRELAAQRGTLLADLDATMTGQEHFFHDPVHTTADGNREMARQIADALLRDLGAGPA